MIPTKIDEKRISAAAKKFAERWEGKGYEKGETQSFWIDLLQNVFEMYQATEKISFEKQVKLKSTSFIDAYIHPTKVLIEQKSWGKDLRGQLLQSDNKMLTPFEQAKRYADELEYSLKPRWIVTCNFREWLIYDMEHPHDEPQQVLLSNLHKEWRHLLFLIDDKKQEVKKEVEISVKAGQLIGKIYDLLQKQYLEPDSKDTLRYLNIICVRLVFCLYSEDANVFPVHQQFGEYLLKHKQANGDIRKALIELFEVLNTPEKERDPYMDADLMAFPYVSGNLFKDKAVVIPNFTPELTDLLIDHASQGVDWSEISPTIFGAVFESTLNPETRRSGGMHYTSEENIHKAIDPLFLDQLKEEFAAICKQYTDEQLTKGRGLAKLEAFQNKLANMRFFDPACGSGNFLTETYISIRRLENEVIKKMLGGQMVLGDFKDPIKVKVDQFYGIEINDFAVTVGQTALWIAEAQMMKETEEIVHKAIDFLPLKSYAHITEGNALRIDWESLFEDGHMPDYIMGNPPFIGARMKSEEQAEDMLHVFGKSYHNVGNLDYVAAWYFLAAQLMFNHDGVRTAFVSTNSIVQGEQVPILWKPICMMNMHIDFAYRTFRWDSESSQKAHVHCVIIGFSNSYNQSRVLYSENGICEHVSHINPYLVEGVDAFIESRTMPIANVPEIGIGNKPIDGGNYLFTEEEKRDFVAKEPKSEIYFKRWYGSEEFINNKVRYCLWLGNCSPAELRSMPHCYERVCNVREFRLASKSAGTRKIADKPTRFHVENMPKSTYILIPETSSERRRYVPMGFMQPDVLCSNAVRLIPNATIYHFGILTSSVHMAWMRAVAGRLKSDYRYSKDIVYNNFPWPNPTPEQMMKIETSANTILFARDLYPDSSLADLYDEVLMPIELRKAHMLNDNAVRAAYGFSPEMTEADIVARLFELYNEMA